ncbi:unnamed protein product [Arctogadus glacialis]
MGYQPIRHQIHKSQCWNTVVSDKQDVLCEDSLIVRSVHRLQGGNARGQGGRTWPNSTLCVGSSRGPNHEGPGNKAGANKRRPRLSYSPHKQDTLLTPCVDSLSHARAEPAVTPADWPTQHGHLLVLGPLELQHKALSWPGSPSLPTGISSRAGED